MYTKNKIHEPIHFHFLILLLIKHMMFNHKQTGEEKLTQGKI